MEKRVHVLPKGAHCSKANKQARLVERRVCFISDAGSWWGSGQTSVQRLTTPTPGNQGGKSFHRQKWPGKGATCRNSSQL